jgi:hypothetical protein
MATDFLPSAASALIEWGGNFKTKIAISPVTYGLSAAQVTSYSAKYDALVLAHTVSTDPATRSPMNVELKNEAKRIFIAEARLLAGVVQRFPGTTNAMRIDLGLTPRDTQPTPIPVPGISPTILVKKIVGRAVTFSVIDASQPTRRGRPAGVDGVTILSHVGDAPPESLADWKLEGSTSRMTPISVVFPVTVAPFAKVWLTAYYFNPRKESGIAATPVCTFLAAGQLPMAA